jgi:SAM-dependent methyltransferase
VTDDETLRVYEAKAADYAALGITETQIAALDAFLAQLPEGGAILDIGCGPGLHAAFMQARGFTLTAIEPSPAFRAEAQARGINVRDGTFDTVTQTAAFDGVWASFCLLHARRADLPRHVAAMARSLRPGGTLFVGMKTGEGERRDTLGRFYTYVSDAELTALVEATGLTVTSRVAGAETGLDGAVAPYILMMARKHA